MRNAQLSILLLCIAATAPSQSTWNNDYTGTIGSAKVGLTLVSNSVGKIERGDKLACSYFYESKLTDIELHCRIDEDGTFIFDEFDKQGKVYAVFKGRLVENQVDSAEGTWTLAGIEKSLPFKLRMFQGVSAVRGNRYEQIEAKDPTAFEDAVRAFRIAVIGGKREKVVAQIKYPIRVYVNGRSVRIPNRKAMLNTYDRVFDRGFVGSIVKTVPHNMFCRYDGAMLGSGLVWFWGDGKVIGINN